CEGPHGLTRAGVGEASGSQGPEERRQGARRVPRRDRQAGKITRRPCVERGLIHNGDALFLGASKDITLKKFLEWACGLLSAAALFAIMALTFFDVGGRKLLDNSIPGSLELTELLMVIVIFASLPLVSLRGEHVLFDSFDAYLSPRVLRLQKAVIDLAIAVALLALAVLM